MIRSAHTDARGSTTSVMVAINTAIRIWVKYAKKAVSEPTCIWPRSMRSPPNQISATLDTLMVSVVTGSISACQLPAVSDGIRQRGIGASEPVALKAFAGKRPDHPHAGQLVAQHPIDAVDQALHAAEQRQHVRHDPVVGHAPGSGR